MERGERDRERPEHRHADSQNGLIFLCVSASMLLIPRVRRIIAKGETLEKHDIGPREHDSVRGV